MSKERIKFVPNSFAALIPFLVFIIVTIILTFKNAADIKMMVAAGLFGLILGMFFSKDWSKYWEVVVSGLGNKSAMTAVLIWLFVGIFGGILQIGNLVEGLVWVSEGIGISGATFTLFTFIVSAIFAISTGTGFGTISTMGFILYPSGLLVGSHPVFLAGAILSGAAFGDNMAPVSDTTIISATSQEYTQKEGIADIGEVVKNRIKYALPAGIIAGILYLIVGGRGEVSVASEQAINILQSHINPKGLLLLIPTAIVIYTAIKGYSIFRALTFGIISSIIVGLPANLFKFSDLIKIEGNKVVGAIPEGALGMANVSILLMVVVAMSQILIKSGAMEKSVEWLEKNAIKSPKSSEITIWGLSTLFAILIAAINTIAIICAAPFVNAIGKITKLHPNRRANFLAAVSCSWPFFVPYGGCVLLLIGTMETVSNTYEFVTPLAPSSLFFAVFYAWLIWIVMLVAALTGWGREFEGKNGKSVKSSKNEIPKEILNED